MKLLRRFHCLEMDVFKTIAGGEGCPDWAKLEEKGSKLTLAQLKMIAPLVSVAKSYGKMELLQSGDLNENQAVWKELAEQFNNSEHNSGSFVKANDEALLHAGIDTERSNTSGEIESKKVFDLFRATVKKYAQAHSKFFQATGVHLQKYFLKYCFEDLDVYYMYLCLEASGDLDMNEFCKEGIADEYGVGSSGAAAASGDDGASASSKKR
ncbi:hypothetical protein B484DRAFT_402073 [Ochromonadaceae sp. CCMP2298]|nr:hypothetical protein B484DRAFT_402073 [Ochromonadaceae sp. CCMP2298]